MVLFLICVATQYNAFIISYIMPICNVYFLKLSLVCFDCLSAEDDACRATYLWDHRSRNAAIALGRYAYQKHCAVKCTPRRIRTNSCDTVDENAGRFLIWFENHCTRNPRHLQTLVLFTSIPSQIIERNGDSCWQVKGRPI